MTDRMGNWLEQLGFGEYAAVFAEQRIDFEVLSELTDSDLKELGVPLGPRKKLLKAIKDLQPEFATPLPETVHPTPETAHAERRQLTVMFCDLVGSTELSQKLDPEDLREVNRLYQDACKSAIERYDGYVARYMGDGVLAYFGYPQAHEDDAERAIHAGLGLVQAVNQLGTGVQIEQAAELAVRVGIATGPVVVGDLIGEGASQESAVVGETPNLAARLQALAAPNTVIVSSGTYDLAGGGFDYADLGTHEIKGIAGSVAAWRVIAPSGVESRFEALHRTALTPLVGREHEVALLLDRWQQAKEGEGQVVLLSGEAGIGKSRITQTVGERTAPDEPVRLRFQCSAYHTNSALYPVIQQLERSGGIERDDSAETKLDKIESLLSLSTQDVGEVAPLLASLLSVPITGRYPPIEMTSEQQREKTLEALIAQMKGLSLHKPVLFIFEDVHWADPTTLGLLELTIEQAQSVPVLVLITYRPEFAQPWTGYTHVTLLTLNRFSRSLVTDMVEKVTGGRPLPDEVRDQIVEKTDGVPLFVEELTKTILESGLVEETSDRFVLSGSMTAAVIPTTLHDSLMARLDRLGPVKEVAQSASVIGREFDYDLLAAASSLSFLELHDALGQLVDAELVFRRSRSPQGSYVFKHALVQDAAYESLLRSKRQQIHARIAAVLESRFPDRTEAEPELLAHHYTEAGLGEPAVEYWLRAGRRAIERSADQEAVGHLDEGLAVLQTLPESTERDHRELELQMALSRALTTTRGWGSEESVNAYARARELCDVVGDSDHLLYVLWGQRIKCWVDAEYSEALEIVAKIISLAEQQDDPMELAAANLVAGWPYLALGEFRAIPSAIDNALKLYDRKKHVRFRFRYGLDLRVTALAIRGYQQWLCGFPDQGVFSFAEAITWVRELDHAGSLAWALNWAGAQPACMRRDVQTARELADELLALPDKVRSPADLAWGQVFAGWAMGKRGHHEEGVSLLREGLEYLIAKELKMLRSVHLGLLADLYIDNGEFEMALRTLDEAVHHAGRSGERLWEPELLRLRGEALINAGAGDGEISEALFKQAIDVARGLGAKSLELRATASLARLWHSQGRSGEAHEILFPVYDWFTEGFDTTDLKDAKALLESMS